MTRGLPCPWLICLLLAASLVDAPLALSAKEKPPSAIHDTPVDIDDLPYEQAIQKLNIPFRKDLPQLFVCGDSITLGYGPALKEALEDKVNCVNRRDLPASNVPGKQMLDPCVPATYSLGCDRTEIKNVFAKDLADSVAGERTVESTALVAQRLTVITTSIRDPKVRAACAESLLPVVAGKERHRVTVTLPKNGGAQEAEVVDPCAVRIYQLLGKPVPAPAAATVDDSAA